MAQISRELAAALLPKVKEEAERRKRSLEIAEACGSSFRKFIPEAWSIVEPAKPYIQNCWHIEAIADHMQAIADGHIKNLIIVVPPGSAKSTLVSVMFPAWKWIKDPTWRATIASYESGLSTQFSVRCRDLMESVWYRETFKPTWSLSTIQNEKTYYVNTVKGFRVATSVDGKGTGWRSNFLGIDDALSTDARFSEPTLRACIRWYENVFYNRLIDLRTGCRVIIGQRVCDNDLIGHLLRKGGYELLLIPMEYSPARSRVTSIGWKDPRQKAGDLMFEPLFPRSVIDDLKQNPDVWHTQYQGHPNIEGGGILKSHLWNYWQPRGADLPAVRVKMPDDTIDIRRPVDYPDSFDIEAQGWDFAFKDLKTSDFIAGLHVGARGANRFIGLHAAHAKMDLPASLNAVRLMTGHYPKAYLKLVEAKANGPAVVQSLRNEIPGMVEVEPEGTKIARAVAGTPELQSGNWFLPHPMIAPWVGNPENPSEDGFLAETVAFPFGVNDDYVDSWSMISARLQKEQIGGVFRITEADVRVDPFEFDEKWPRMYGLAITWKEVAAVWMCRRPETGQYYLYAEYCVDATSPAQHAAEIVKPGSWIQGVVTPVDIGRDEKDGFALIGKYRKLGLKLHSVRANEEAMIVDLQEALRAGKVKLFGNLSTLLGQYRMFRRDDRTGKLPDQFVGAVKAMLVAWAGRDHIKAPPEPPKPERASAYREGPSVHSWMSS